MSDRFRELEKPVDERRLDVVLMATVTSFEDLERPTRYDLRQFSGLFTPLFRAASTETKRVAAAALSRCPTVPPEVILLIADEPVDVCAPFLAHSAALSDVEIAEIVARRGASHARSLARRNGLSARAVAILAQTGDAAVVRSLTLRGLLPQQAGEDDAEALRRQRDENLRLRLRAMVAPPTSPTEMDASSEVVRLDEGDAERLARFAEAREPLYFATALADVLGVSFQVAERIMLDISGRDLAGTLVAIGFGRDAAVIALEAFFPHLAAPAGTQSRAEGVVDDCDADHAGERLAALVRTGRRDAARHEPHVVDATKAERPRDGLRPAPPQHQRSLRRA